MVFGKISHLLGINHYACPSTSRFIEKDADLSDSAYVTLLCGSMMTAHYRSHRFHLDWPQPQWTLASLVSNWGIPSLLWLNFHDKRGWSEYQTLLDHSQYNCGFFTHILLWTLTEHCIMKLYNTEFFIFKGTLYPWGLLSGQRVESRLIVIHTPPLVIHQGYTLPTAHCGPSLIKL